MTGAHGHPLYVHRHGAVHELAPQCKVAATFAFVVAVVVTPREAFWAFGVDAAVLVAVAALARVPFGFLARRLVFEVPFLAFALFLPIVGQGERIDVAGLSLSVEGLWGAWNIFVKATLGLLATVLLAATTTVPELLRGLDRLHLPRVLTAIMGFMVRYGEVLAGDLRRLRIARQSRADDPRWLWQARGVAASAGALFVRSFERGERVHVAMLARGFDGTVPDLDEGSGTAPRWAVAMVPPAIAAAAATAAWVLA